MRLPIPGNEIILWGKAGADPAVPADFTRE
jgi:hypothetical protein